MHLWYSRHYKCINPDELTEVQWQHLYGLDTKHQRVKYCQGLLEKKEATAKKMKLREEKREANKGLRERIRAEREANPHIVYGLGHNSLHIRITNRVITKWLHSK